MKTYVRSPLNYIGGKYKILNEILPLFPDEIGTFVDLFAGGFNVGINVSADLILANDQLTYLIDLYKYFQNISWAELEKSIVEKIDLFNLSSTNKDGYIALRDEYNIHKSDLDLFLLTCYSFNHQIRFNNKHSFNTPFGKERSSYNSAIAQNLKAFLYNIQRKNIIFKNEDFSKIDLSILKPGDYVYCDPPYLITTGSYNDGKRGFKDWTDKEEMQLLSLLDDLNQKNIFFGLSNVIEHKGMKNEILISWSKKYITHYIDKNYSNCSYHLKNRTSQTIEVFITNFSSKETVCQPKQMMLF